MTTEYTGAKDFISDDSHFSRYAVISVFQNSENSGYKYQVAPDMAMTVRMIMILLYGAGGVPGRG